MVLQQSRTMTTITTPSQLMIRIITTILCQDPLTTNGGFQFSTILKAMRSQADTPCGQRRYAIASLPEIFYKFFYFGFYLFFQCGWCFISFLTLIFQPLQPGERREWEDWEGVVYLSFLLFALLLAYVAQPHIFFIEFVANASTDTIGYLSVPVKHQRSGLWNKFSIAVLSAPPTSRVSDLNESLYCIKFTRCAFYLMLYFFCY